MSATQSQNESCEQPNPPAITIFTRVASIPMISSSLESINDVLTKNALTRQPYAHAKGISTTAYKLTEPLQVRLAPLIVHADGFANNVVDVVQARYPYPFQVQPQEVVTYVRERKNTTISGVNKALDDKVKKPVINVAQGIDNRFTPIIDYFEHAVSKFNHSDAGSSTSPDVKYQYQRALVLSKTLGENLYVYSNDQLKHLQAQSVIAQRASEIGHSITSAASSSLSSAQSRIYSLSDAMVHELQKLQASASQLTTSLQSGVQDSASHLQHQVQQIQHSYGDLSAALSATVTELTSIIKKKDLPVQEKVSRVSKEVQNRVTPLLETVKKGVSEVLARSKEAAPSGDTNGYAASSNQ